MRIVLLVILFLPSLAMGTFPLSDTDEHDHKPHIIGQDIKELGIKESELTPIHFTLSLGVGKNEPFTQLPMRYPTYSHPKADKLTALAVYSRGRPIVLYSPKAAKKLASEVMGSILQHEYCHHDLSHLRQRGSAALEAQADCCGAYNLKEYGREELLNEIIAFNRDKKCKYDAKTPLRRVKGSHPCGPQRSYVYEYCAVNNVKQLPEDFLNEEIPL